MAKQIFGEKQRKVGKKNFGGEEELFLDEFVGGESMVGTHALKVTLDHLTRNNTFDMFYHQCVRGNMLRATSHTHHLEHC